MQYNEILARRLVAEVARSSIDGGALQPVMLHEVACRLCRLKIDETSAESAMYRAVAERWLVFEGSSLFRIRLTEAGRALTFPLRRAAMTLDDAIATLDASEINCGCETFWDGGINVWIGDIMNGHHAETMFSRDNMRKVGAMAGRRGGDTFP